MNLIEQLAQDIGGKIDSAGALPDGSGFAVMSMPLPKDHWLTAEHEDYDAPPMPWRCGKDHPDRERLAADIRAAGKYALRAATMRGKEMDLDPDALLIQLVLGLLGYWTPDGLSSDEWANPKPVPPMLATQESP